MYHVIMFLTTNAYLNSGGTRKKFRREAKNMLGSQTAIVEEREGKSWGGEG